MVLDFIVNLLVLAFIVFLFVNLLCSDSSFEYEFLKWFNRTFGFCKHKNGMKYKILSYQVPDGNIHDPVVEYEIRCATCDKKVDILFVHLSDTIEIPNVYALKDLEWHGISTNDYEELKNKNIK